MAVVSLAVLAGGVVAGTTAVAAIDVVAATQSAALPAIPSGPPGSLTTIDWHVRLPETEELVAGSGRYLVLSTGDGVEVRDAETGALRWQYRRRSDVYTLVAAPLAADGSVIEAVFTQGTAHTADTVVVGLDTATGRIRWQWSLPSFTAAYGDPATPNWTVAGGTLVDDAPVATYTEPLVPLDVMAYGFNPQTGALKWQVRSPDPGECVPDGQNAPVAVTGEILAVGLECSSASNPVSMIFSSSPGLLAVDTGSASAPDLTFLDAQTGRKLASFRQSGAVIGETLTEHTLTSGTPPLLLQGSGGSPEVTVTAFGDGTQPLWKTTLGWPGLADPSETLLLTTQAGQETYLVGLGATSATIAVYGIGADGSHPAAPALLPIPAYGGIDRVLTTPRRLILEIDEPRADAASIDLYGIG